MPARRGRTIGNTAGGRGPIPSTVRNQADYYRSGRSSAFNPGGTVRDSTGRRVSGTRGGAKS